MVAMIVCDRVNFVTQEAAKRYLQQQHDEMLRIKETTDNEESLLRQLDSRVSAIRCIVRV